MLLGAALLGFGSSAQAVVVGYEAYLKGLTPDENGVYQVAPGTVLEYRLAIDLGETQWDDHETGDTGSAPIDAAISSYTLSISLIEILPLEFSAALADFVIDDGGDAHGVSLVDVFSSAVLARDTAMQYSFDPIHFSFQNLIEVSVWGGTSHSGYRANPAVQLVVYRDGSDALDLQMPNTAAEVGDGRVVILGLRIPLRADIADGMGFSISMPEEFFGPQAIRHPLPGYSAVANARTDEDETTVNLPAPITINVQSRELAAAVLSGETELAQEEHSFNPVIATYVLSGVDQYGDAFPVADVDVALAVDAGATAVIVTRTRVVGTLSHAVTVLVTLAPGQGATLTLTASADGAELDSLRVSIAPAVIAERVLAIADATSLTASIAAGQPGPNLSLAENRAELEANPVLGGTNQSFAEGETRTYVMSLLDGFFTQNPVPVTPGTALLFEIVGAGAGDYAISASSDGNLPADPSGTTATGVFDVAAFSIYLRITALADDDDYLDPEAARVRITRLSGDPISAQSLAGFTLSTTDDDPLPELAAAVLSGATELTQEEHSFNPVIATYVLSGVDQYGDAFPVADVDVALAVDAGATAVIVTRTRVVGTLSHAVTVLVTLAPGQGATLTLTASADGAELDSLRVSIAPAVIAERVLAIADATSLTASIAAGQPGPNLSLAENRAELEANPVLGGTNQSFAEGETRTYVMSLLDGFFTQNPVPVTPGTALRFEVTGAGADNYAISASSDGNLPADPSGTTATGVFDVAAFSIYLRIEALADDRDYTDPEAARVRITRLSGDPISAQSLAGFTLSTTDDDPLPELAAAQWSGATELTQEEHSFNPVIATYVLSGVDQYGDAFPVADVDVALAVDAGATAVIVTRTRVVGTLSHAVTVLVTLAPGLGATLTLTASANGAELDSLRVSIAPAVIAERVLAIADATSLTASIAAGQPGPNLSLAENRAELEANPVLGGTNQSFAEGETRTYVMSLLDGFFTQNPVPVTPGTALLFEIVGAGAGDYAISASSDGNLPADPSGTTATGVFDVAAFSIYLRITALADDDDYLDPEAARVRITRLSGDPISAQSLAGFTLSTTDDDPLPELAAAQWSGATELAQEEHSFNPVIATYVLSGVDQYGDVFPVSGAEVALDAGAGASAAVVTRTRVVGTLSDAVTVLVTPVPGQGATLTLTANVNGVTLASLQVSIAPAVIAERVLAIADATSLTANIAGGQPGPNLSLAENRAELEANPVLGGTNQSFAEGETRTYVMSLLDGFFSQNPVPVTPGTALLFEIVGPGAGDYAISASSDGNLPADPTTRTTTGVFDAMAFSIYLRIEALADDDVATNPHAYLDPQPARVRITRLSGDPISAQSLAGFTLSTTDDDRAPQRLVVMADLTNYPPDAPLKDIAAGEPTGLSFTANVLSDLASARINPDVSIAFAEGEVVTYALALLGNLSTMPQLAEPNTALLFTITGPGADAYRVSASSDGNIPADPVSTSTVGVFFNDLNEGVGAIFLRIVALQDDDFDDPAPAWLEISRLSGNSLFALDDEPRQNPLSTTDDDLPPPALSVLQFVGETEVTQQEHSFNPVIETYVLVGFDQYGDAFPVADAEVSVAIDAGATAVIVTRTQVVGTLSHAVTVLVTLAPGQGATLTLTASADGVEPGSLEVSIMPAVIAERVLAIADATSLTADIAGGQPGPNLSLAENRAELEANPVLGGTNQSFAEGETRTYVMSLLDGFFTQNPVPVTPGTALLFEIVGAGAGDYAISASSDGNLPADPSGTTATGVFDVAAFSIYLRIEALADDDDYLDPEAARVRITRLSGDPISAQSLAGFTLSTTDDDPLPELAAAVLSGATELTQEEHSFNPVIATYVLSGVDQYGDAFPVADVDVALAVDAGATAVIVTRTRVVGTLSHAVTVLVTLAPGQGATLTLTASADGAELDSLRVSIAPAVIAERVLAIADATSLTASIAAGQPGPNLSLAENRAELEANPVLGGTNQSFAEGETRTYVMSLLDGFFTQNPVPVTPGTALLFEIVGAGAGDYAISASSDGNLPADPSGTTATGVFDVAAFSIYLRIEALADDRDYTDPEAARVRITRLSGDPISAQSLAGFTLSTTDDDPLPELAAAQWSGATELTQEEHSFNPVIATYVLSGVDQYGDAFPVADVDVALAVDAGATAVIVTRTRVVGTLSHAVTVLVTLAPGQSATLTLTASANGAELDSLRVSIAPAVIAERVLAIADATSLTASIAAGQPGPNLSLAENRAELEANPVLGGTNQSFAEGETRTYVMSLLDGFFTQNPVPVTPGTALLFEIVGAGAGDYAISASSDGNLPADPSGTTATGVFDVAAFSIYLRITALADDDDYLDPEAARVRITRLSGDPISAQSLAGFTLSTTDDDPLPELAAAVLSGATELTQEEHSFNPVIATYVLSGVDQYGDAFPVADVDVALAVDAGATAVIVTRTRVVGTLSHAVTVLVTLAPGQGATLTLTASADGAELDSLRVSIAPAVIAERVLAIADATSLTASIAAGQPGPNLSLAENRAELEANPVLGGTNQSFAEGETRTYVMSLLDGFFTQNPVPVTPGTALLFEIVGAGAGDYAISASSDGNLPADPSGTTATGVFDVAAFSIYLRIEALADDRDYADPEAARVRITRLSGDPISAQSLAGFTLSTTDDDPLPELAAAQWSGATELAQEEHSFNPVIATYVLSGVDQYGDVFPVSGAEVALDAGAGASAAVVTRTRVVGTLSDAVTVLVTPVPGQGATLTLTANVNGVTLASLQVSIAPAVIAERVLAIADATSLTANIAGGQPGPNLSLAENRAELEANPVLGGTNQSFAEGETRTYVMSLLDGFFSQNPVPVTPGTALLFEIVGPGAGDYAISASSDGNLPADPTTRTTTGVFDVMAFSIYLRIEALADDDVSTNPHAYLDPQPARVRITRLSGDPISAQSLAGFTLSTTDDDRAPQRLVVMADLTNYPPDAPLKDIAAGEPTGLSFTANVLSDLASARINPDVSIAFAEGEVVTYALALLGNLSTMPQLAEPNTALLFTIAGPGADAYRVSASSDGNIPADPVSTSTVGVFFNDLNEGVGAIFLRIVALQDDDFADPAPARLEISRLSGNSLFALDDEPRQNPLSTTDDDLPPPALSVLQFVGETEVTQQEHSFNPVIETYVLVGFDQYGDAFPVADAEVSVAIDAGATAVIVTRTQVVGTLSHAVTVLVTLAPGQGATLTLTASADGVEPGSLEVSIMPAVIAERVLAIADATSLTADIAAGQPGPNLSLAENRAELEANPVLGGTNQSFAEGETRTYVMSLLDGFFTQNPVPVTPGTALLFEIVGAGAGDYAISASSDGNLPADPSGTTATGVFDVAAFSIYLRITALADDDDYLDPEAARVRITRLSGDPISAQSLAGFTLSTTDDDPLPELAAAVLSGATELTQEEHSFNPVIATYVLSGVDQYGDAFPVADVDVALAVDAGATAVIVTRTRVVGTLSHAVTVLVTLAPGQSATLTLTASANGAELDSLRVSIAPAVIAERVLAIADATSLTASIAAGQPGPNLSLAENRAELEANPVLGGTNQSFAEGETRTYVMSLLDGFFTQNPVPVTPGTALLFEIVGAGAGDYAISASSDGNLPADPSGTTATGVFDVAAFSIYLRIEALADDRDYTDPEAARVRITRLSGDPISAQSLAGFTLSTTDDDPLPELAAAQWSGATELTQEEHSFNPVIATYVLSGVDQYGDAFPVADVDVALAVDAGATAVIVTRTRVVGTLSHAVTVLVTLAPGQGATLTLTASADGAELDSLRVSIAPAVIAERVLAIADATSLTASIAAGQPGPNLSLAENRAELEANPVLGGTNQSFAEGETRTYVMSLLDGFFTQNPVPVTPGTALLFEIVGAGAGDYAISASSDGNLPADPSGTTATGVFDVAAFSIYLRITALADDDDYLDPEAARVRITRLSGDPISAQSLAGFTLSTTDDDPLPELAAAVLSGATELAQEGHSFNPVIATYVLSGVDQYGDAFPVADVDVALAVDAGATAVIVTRTRVVGTLSHAVTVLVTLAPGQGATLTLTASADGAELDSLRVSIAPAVIAERVLAIADATSLTASIAAGQPGPNLSLAENRAELEANPVLGGTNQSFAEGETRTYVMSLLDGFFTQNPVPVTPGTALLFEIVGAGAGDYAISASSDGNLPADPSGTTATGVFDVAAFSIYLRITALADDDDYLDPEAARVRITRLSGDPISAQSLAGFTLSTTDDDPLPELAAAQWSGATELAQEEHSFNPVIATYVLSGVDQYGDVFPVSGAEVALDAGAGASAAVVTRTRVVGTLSDAVTVLVTPVPGQGATLTLTANVNGVTLASLQVSIAPAVIAERVLAIADATSLTANIAGGQPGPNLSLAENRAELEANPVLGGTNQSFAEGETRTYVMSLLDGFFSQNPVPVTPGTALLFEIVGPGAGDYAISASSDGNLPADPTTRTTTGVFDAMAFSIYLRIEALADDDVATNPHAYLDPQPARVRITRLSGDPISEQSLGGFTLSTTDDDRAPQRLVVMADLTNYPPDAPLKDIAAGEPTGLSFTANVLSDLASARINPDVSIAFAEGEVVTYALALLGNLSTMPQLAEPNTALLFTITGPGADAYRVSASSDGNIPADPVSTSTVGVFFNDLNEGVGAIFLRIVALQDDDFDDPAPARLEISRLSGNSLFALDDEPRQNPLSTTDDDLPPPALSVLQFGNAPTGTLTQAAIGESVQVALSLSGLDQYDEAFDVSAASIATSATAGAVVDVVREDAADGLSATLTLTITPDADNDARVTLLASQGDVSAEVVIDVDAVDRRPEELQLLAERGIWEQDEIDATVTSTIRVRNVLDNYGDAWQPSLVEGTDIVISVLSSDGQTPTVLPYEPLAGSSVNNGLIFVRIAPRLNVDTTLTVTARLIDADREFQIQTFIRAVPAVPQLRLSDLNGDTDLSRTLMMAGDAAEIQLRLQYFFHEGRPADYPSMVTLASEIVSGGNALVVLGATSFASLDAAGATLTVVITPDEDSEAVIRLSADAAADMLAADMMITVTPEAREAANIVLASTTQTLAQANFGDTVLASFTLLAVDNYGRDDVLPVTVSLLAAASNGASAALLDAAADGEVTIGAGGVRVEVEVTLADGRDSVLSLTATHDALGAFNAQVSISAAPIPVSVGFTGNNDVRDMDMVVLVVLLEDIDLFSRAYDANCSVIDEAARAEILTELRRRGLPVRNVTLGEALDRAACAAVRQLDDGSGALLDVDGDGDVTVDDADMISLVRSIRRRLGYAYDEDGMLIPERAFILDAMARNASRTNARFPSDLDQAREILQRIYLRLFHSSSPYTP